jgi:hypothetical protein
MFRLDFVIGDGWKEGVTVEFVVGTDRRRCGEALGGVKNNGWDSVAERLTTAFRVREDKNFMKQRQWSRLG